MIEINKYELKNGLRLIHSCDPTIQMATVNTLYDVGAKKEMPGKTGLAHLMEHLMFAGSRNVKNINEHIRRAGGSLNAFTDSDITREDKSVIFSEHRKALGEAFGFDGAKMFMADQVDKTGSYFEITPEYVEQNPKGWTDINQDILVIKNSKI